MVGTVAEKRRVWTDEEIDLVRTQYRLRGSAWLAIQLRRTELAVLRKVKELRLSKQAPRKDEPVPDHYAMKLFARKVKFAACREVTTGVVALAYPREGTIVRRPLTCDGEASGVFDWGRGCDVTRSMNLALQILITVANACRWGDRYDGCGERVADRYHTFRIELIEKLPARSWVLTADLVLDWLNRDRTGREILRAITGDVSEED